VVELPVGIKRPHNDVVWTSRW